MVWYDRILHKIFFANIISIHRKYQVDVPINVSILAGFIANYIKTDIQYTFSLMDGPLCKIVFYKYIKGFRRAAAVY